MTQVLIVEDDAQVRQRLQRVAAQVHPRLDCAMAGTVAQARACIDRQAFDLVLLDIGLPDGDGIALLPWLQAQLPRADAVVVSCLGDDVTVLRAIRAGAVGYLLKNGDDTELALSLRSMQRGGAPIDPVIARRILALMATTASTGTTGTATAQPMAATSTCLTEREMEILRRVSQGHSNREVAEILHLSINTVECHAKNIYRKLSVRSRSAAVHSARLMGLLP